MSFMQKQVERFSAWQVETTCGTEMVPCDVTDAAGLPDYLEGKPLQLDDGDGGNGDIWPVCERVTGWFCRLSAPGYMDCTEWSGPYETEDAAREALDDMYPDDEYGE